MHNLSFTFGKLGWLAGVLALVTACASTTRTPNTTTASVASPEEAQWGDDEDENNDADPADDDATVTSNDPAAPCPSNMVLVADAERGVRVCVDKYEGSLVEVDANGTEKPHPHWQPVDGHTVRAVSVPAVLPQGYISEVQAEDACHASGKRLCTLVEWRTACMGPSKTTFPYGNARKPGTCNDTGKSAVAAVFGYQRLADPVAPSIARANAPHARPVASAKGKRAAETTKSRKARPTTSTTTVAKADATPKKKHAKTARTASAAKRVAAKSSVRPASVEPSVWDQLNDPRLGQVEGGLAMTGSHAACESGYGAVDMVGNIHEWVKTDATLPHGTFAGGYFLDTSINGDGCQYKTSAHAHDYHDYSTGFRCCAEPDSSN